MVLQKKRNVLVCSLQLGVAMHDKFGQWDARLSIMGKFLGDTLWRQSMPAFHLSFSSSLPASCCLDREEG